MSQEFPTASLKITLLLKNVELCLETDLLRSGLRVSFQTKHAIPTLVQSTANQVRQDSLGHLIVRRSAASCIRCTLKNVSVLSVARLLGNRRDASVERYFTIPIIIILIKRYSLTRVKLTALYKHLITKTTLTYISANKTVIIVA